MVLQTDVDYPLQFFIKILLLSLDYYVALDAPLFFRVSHRAQRSLSRNIALDCTLALPV